jgi:hypothetical protein
VRHLQALDDLVVERENIPIYMPVGLDERVVKSCQLLKVYPSVVQSSDDGLPLVAPRSTAKKKFLLFIDVIVFVVGFYYLVLRCKIKCFSKPQA